MYITFTDFYLLHWHLSPFDVFSSSAGWGISWSLPSWFPSRLPWRRPGGRPAVPSACPHLQPSAREETHLLRGTPGQPEQTGPAAQTTVCLPRTAAEQVTDPSPVSRCTASLNLWDKRVISAEYALLQWSCRRWCFAEWVALKLFYKGELLCFVWRYG